MIDGLSTRPWERSTPSMGMVLSLAFLLLTLLPTSVLAQGDGSEEARPALQIEDMFKIKRVGSPQVSPDGQWVAYTVNTSSLEPGKSGTRIWMVPADGGDAIPMTAEGYSASSPDWSPDGKYLSFLATRGDSARAGSRWSAARPVSTRGGG